MVATPTRAWPRWQWKKSFCLRGCRIGADALANSDYKTLVPLTAHRDILDTAEKQKIILAVTGRVKELRNEASVEAASFCSRKNRSSSLRARSAWRERSRSILKCCSRYTEHSHCNIHILWTMGGERVMS